MRWTFQRHDHPGPVERARHTGPGWRLHAATFADGDRQWQAIVEVNRPPGSPMSWLAQAHGFLVDDDAEHEVGVVDDIQLDPATERPSALVVVQGWGRKKILIPIDAVIEIAPDERRLIVVRGNQQPT